jgi:hypothetical protein
MVVGYLIVKLIKFYVPARFALKWQSNFTLHILARETFILCGKVSNHLRNLEKKLVPFSKKWHTLAE